MAKCEFCEKTMSTGNKISIARSHVSRRSLRTFKPNLRTVNVDGENRKMKVCAKCLRSFKNAAND